MSIKRACIQQARKTQVLLIFYTFVLNDCIDIKKEKKICASTVDKKVTIQLCPVTFVLVETKYFVINVQKHCKSSKVSMMNK